MNTVPSRLYDFTPPQRSIYNSIRFYGKSEIFNICATLTFSQRIDPLVLERALNSLIETNDALRIRVGGSGLDPKQYITPYRYEPITRLDLSQLNEPEIERRLADIGRQSLFGFHKKLYDFSLVNYGSRYGGFLKVSHIVVDGFSLVLLATQLEEACRKLMSGSSMEPRPSYVEFIQRQQAYLSSEQCLHDEAYWKRELAGAADVPYLGRAFRRNAPVDSLEAAREKVFIAEETTREVYRFCSGHRLSLLSLFVAGSASYLARIRGRDDIIIGTPILNRVPHERLTAGMFVSLLPLRIRLCPGKSFIENVQAAHRQVLRMLRHARFPSEAALELFRAQNNTADLPYDLAVSFQPASFARTPQSLDYEADWLFNGFETNTLLLSIGDRDAKGRLTIEADYRLGILDGELVNRVLGNLRTLLADGMAHPQKPLSELELLSEDEKRELVHGLNPGRVREMSPLQTLPELFEEQVARAPQAPALVCGEGMRYLELHQKVNQLARCLRSRGVQPGVAVGVMVGRSAHMVICLLAVLKAGGCYVPIEPGHPAQRTAHILADSKAKLLLTAAGVDAVPLGVCALDVGAVEESGVGPGDDQQCVNQPDDLAYIMYTSGSSGAPKGVAVPHRSLVTRLLCMKRDFKIEPDDVFLLKTNFMFDVSITEIFLPLLCGSRMVILPPGCEREPDALARSIAEHGVTVANFVPSMLAVFLEFLARDMGRLTRLRYIFCAGEALSPALVQRARSLLGDSVKLANQYGPTETSYATACIEVGQGDTVSIGKPMDQTVVYILDRFRGLLPRGVRGELYVGGAGLARGYVANEVLTRERFSRSPFAPNETLYRTGDYGRWLADGNVEFLGREDNQVKVRGFRVELGEIERVLERHAGVAQAVVLLKEGTLTAYVRADRPLDETTLRSSLKRTLPVWMIPSEFVFLERMPLTPNGKLDTRALLRSSRRAVPAPAQTGHLTAAECRLRHLWDSTLGNKFIGAEDDFFEIGGDSLKATRLALAIEDTFDVELPVGELYRFRTLRKQAGLIKRQQATMRKGVILLKRGRNPGRSLFFIHGGSGSIGGYVNLFRDPSHTLREEYTVYAIRYDRMKSCAPVEESIESLAADYLDRIKRVHPAGPYTLAAWCIGAQIITEIALLMQAEGLAVERLLFFNSIAPREWGHIEHFTLANEMNFGARLTASAPAALLSGAESIEEVWQRVLHYGKQHPAEVLSSLPRESLESIPNFKGLDISEVLYHTNCMRGLHAARAAYRPRGKLAAQCFFISPDGDRTIPAHLRAQNIQAWSDCFDRPVKVIRVRGDEHSVFDQDIDDNVRAINSVLEDATLPAGQRAVPPDRCEPGFLPAIPTVALGTKKPG